MSKPSDVVNIALAEVGYREKASNSALDDKTANAGGNNWTKYARDLAAAGYYNGNKNGFAWCDVFVDWCFFKAYGAVEGQRIQCQTGPLGAGCIYSAQYYQQKGRYDKTPRVGDQVFFQYGGEIGHTGIVVEVTDSTIVTVEGNSSDQVRRNTYNRSNSYIAGYGHPLYDGKDEDPEIEPAPVEEPVQEPETPASESGIGLGSVVEIKQSAVQYYPGGPYIPGWVKHEYYHTVTQVKVNGKPYTRGGAVCVLLGKKMLKSGGVTMGGINTWVALDSLKLQGGASSEPEPQQASPAVSAVHTVVRGDSLWAIAEKYLGSGARYGEIKSMNGLTSNVIYPGQQLRIPTG